MNQKGFASIPLLLIILISLGSGLYLVSQKTNFLSQAFSGTITGLLFQQSITTSSPQPLTYQLPTSQAAKFIPPSSWVKYDDPDGKFSVWIPPDWKKNRQFYSVTMGNGPNFMYPKEVDLLLGTASCNNCYYIRIHAVPIQYQIQHDGMCNYSRSNGMLAGLPAYLVNQTWDLNTDIGSYEIIYSYPGIKWMSAGGYDLQIDKNNSISESAKQIINTVIASFTPSPLKPLNCDSNQTPVDESKSVHQSDVDKAMLERKSNFTISNFRENPITDPASGKYSAITMTFDVTTKNTGQYTVTGGIGSNDKIPSDSSLFDPFIQTNKQATTNLTINSNQSFPVNITFMPTKKLFENAANGPYYPVISIEWVISTDTSRGTSMKGVSFSGNPNNEIRFGVDTAWIFNSQLKTRNYSYADFTTRSR